jgi:hypothetical protein
MLCTKYGLMLRASGKTYPVHMIVCHVKIMILSLNHELTKKNLKSQNHMKIMKKNLKIIYVCEQSYLFSLVYINVREY